MARFWGGRSAGPGASGPEAVSLGFGFAARSESDAASASSPGVDRSSVVGTVVVHGHLVRIAGIEAQLLDILLAQPGRVVALDAVVAGLGMSAAQALRVARRLSRRLMVSPAFPPLIEIIPWAGIRYMAIE